MMAGCCGAQACTSAVLIDVMRRPGCPFDSAWCLVCELCLLTVVWIDCRCFLSFVFLGGAKRLGLSPCYTEKATPARHRPERQHNACANRRKQCSPNETKSYSNPTPPRTRQNNPTNGQTPRRMKPTHTRLTYTRMRPHPTAGVAGKPKPTLQLQSKKDT